MIHKNFAARAGFTLVEMLVVIGIIGILTAVGINSYARIVKTADRARAQELVSNVATALTALFQQEGVWPPKLREKGMEGQLNAEVSLVLAKGGYLSLSTDNPDSPKYATKLTGVDRFGIVTPWALQLIKRKGNKASESDVIPGSGKATIADSRLYYAIDLDGDGIIKNVNVGGKSISVRATAIAWCIGKDGGKDGQPNAYSSRSGDLYSWSDGQTQNVE